MFALFNRTLAFNLTPLWLIISLTFACLNPSCVSLAFHFPFIFLSFPFHLPVSTLPVCLWPCIFLSFPFHLHVSTLSVCLWPFIFLSFSFHFPFMCLSQPFLCVSGLSFSFHLPVSVIPVWLWAFIFLAFAVSTLETH